MSGERFHVAALQQRERNGEGGGDENCLAQLRILKVRDFARDRCRPVSLPYSGHNRTCIVHEANDPINAKRSEYFDGNFLDVAESIAHRKVTIQQDSCGPRVLPQSVEPANEQSLVAFYICDELACRSNCMCVLAANNLAGYDMKTTSKLSDLSTAGALADPVHPTDKDDSHRAPSNKARTFHFSASDR